jgi:hypothetical protein
MKLLWRLCNTLWSMHGACKFWNVFLHFYYNFIHDGKLLWFVTSMDLSLVILAKIANPLLLAIFNCTTIEPMLIVEI